MFFSLALKNVKRSIRDYLVYFVTLMLSVCIFYMFNSMDEQMVMLGVNDFAYASTVLILIELVSVIVAVVLAFLIIYANTFIMRRRRREIGLYMLLGFSARKTGALLMIETLIIGVLALAAGLAAGYLASQGMSVLTANMFGIAVRNYRFVFSAGAVIKTCVYFGITFLVVMIFNAASVSKQPLTSLLGPSVNERFRIHRRGPAVILIICGILLVVFSYWLVLGHSVNAFAAMFGPAMIVNFSGTLLVIYGISGFIMAAQGSRPKRTLRGLRTFSERQLLSRVSTNAISMTFICTMIFLTLVIVSSVSSINTVIEQTAAQEAPFDFSVTAYQGTGAPPVGTLREHLQNNNVDLSIFSGSTEYHLYDTQVRQGEIADAGSLNADAAETFDMHMMNAVRVSDFNALAALQGDPPIDLPAGTYAVTVPAEQVQKMLQTSPGGSPVDLDGISLTYWDGPVQTLALWTSRYSQDEIRLIIPDAAAENLPASLDVFCGEYADDPASADQLLTSHPELENVSDPNAGETVPAIRMAVASEVTAATRMSLTSVIFVGLYIGMIFLVAGAAILALQQLSAASDDRPRYELLSRLGASRRMIDNSLLSQIAVYFFLPLAVGAVHSIFGIDFAMKSAGTLGVTNIAAGTVTTAVLICIIYGGYFMATYMGARNIIWARAGRRE